MKQFKYFGMARLLPIAAALTIPIIASASTIVGNLALSSSGSQVIAVDDHIIDFNFGGAVSSGFPPTSSDPLNPNGSGLFDVGLASTGSFAGIGGTVTVHNLDSTQQPTGQTSGPGLPLSNFITFSARPTWSITLTQILPGVFSSVDCSATPAVGQTCSPPNSPFNLSNIGGDQVNVNFAFEGIANDGLGNLSNISGTFGTTFSNTSLQAVLAAIQAGDAVVTTASGTLAAVATPVPEPGSASSILLGCSLIGLAALGRSARARRLR